MGIGARIREAREARGLTQRELAGMLGVTPSAITNYENDVSHPKEPVMYKMFAALGVDANYLFQDEMVNISGDYDITPAEHDGIKKYRDLDDHGREAVSSILEIEHRRCEALRNAQASAATDTECSEELAPRLVELPLHHSVVAAGTSNYLDEGDYDMMAFPADEVPNGTSFTLRVSGDSMEPMLYDGDIIFVQGMPTIDDGEIGIFSLNGDGLVKKLMRRGSRPFLVSENKSYKPISVEEHDDCRVLGRVLGKYEQ